jgi:hypothetical protein
LRENLACSDLIEIKVRRERIGSIDARLQACSETRMLWVAARIRGYRAAFYLPLTPPPQFRSAKSACSKPIDGGPEIAWKWPILRAK